MSEEMEAEATSTVPQSQPLPGQVPNKAGGFSWQVDDMQRLRRFLCLGSEGGTYYTSEKALGRENAESIIRLITTGRGKEVVKEIVTYSVEGRAAKQNPIIFALALCARGDDVDTKRAAYESLSQVCRIPTHLFAFVQFCEALSSASGTGWGRAHRRAIQKWYTEKSPKSLAMAVTKYRQREGWSHTDLLRLSHVKSEKPGTSCVFRYVIKGLASCKTDFVGKGQEVDEVLTFLEAVESTKDAKEEDIVHLIQKFRLVREHIPTEHLNSKLVWSTLLQDMPMTALIRNLGKMSAIGLLEPLSGPCKYACERLQDESLLKTARIHPFSVLLALETYRSGKGDKGKLTWDVNQAIVTALNAAFYLSFKFVEPTGKRFLLAVDVSGSMCCAVMGSRSITARVAATAMAMVTARTEKQNMILGFSHQLVPIKIGAHTSLEDAVGIVDQIPMGGTDCALPMLHAIEKKRLVDVFIVYTDSETWFGQVHPSEALKRYRKFSGINAKLVVCGMASNGFSIADPNDPGMLDMVGFDSAAPEVIRNFVLDLF